MVRSGILFFIILLTFGGQIRDTKQDNSQPAKDDIPQRCLENSISSVSCRNVNSDDALLAHPEDCNLFYYCVSPDHEPICRQCPAQLHFNPNKHVCDVPERAGCIIQISSKK
nr:uncharacterized protein LOC113402446 [Vanessa tameamea]